MVVVTNLGNISYLVKNHKYNFEKAVVLLNEAIDLNNKAKNIRDLQDAADYFLKNCYNVGINYENRQGVHTMIEEHVILSERPEDQLKAVEWAREQKKKILDEKNRRIADTLMGKMTPLILKNNVQKQSLNNLYLQGYNYKNFRYITNENSDQMIHNLDTI